MANNAIGTTTVEPHSFSKELAAAGLSGIPMSISPNGYTFADSVDQTTRTQVDQVFSRHNPQISALMAYNANARWEKEMAGMKVKGHVMTTDRESQHMLASQAGQASRDPSFTTEWKMQDGTFVVLTASELITAHADVTAFIGRCFATESNVKDGIHAVPPTITTTAQIDAAYAAL
jgi:hypothetical protein